MGPKKTSSTTFKELKTSSVINDLSTYLLKMYPLRYVFGDVNKPDTDSLSVVLGPEWKPRIGNKMYRLQMIGTTGTAKKNKGLLNVYLYGMWADKLYSVVKPLVDKKMSVKFTMKASRGFIKDRLVSDKNDMDGSSQRPNLKVCIVVDDADEDTENFALSVTGVDPATGAVDEAGTVEISSDTLKDFTYKSKPSPLKFQKKKARATEADEAEVGGRKKKSKSMRKDETPREFKTLVEAREMALNGEKDTNINVVAMLVSMQRPSRITRPGSSHKYMQSFNIIDPSIGDPKDAVAVNIFVGGDKATGDDTDGLSSLPKIARCGDLVRLHRVKTNVWQNNLQLVGWPDDGRTTITVVRRRTEICTGLPVMENESTESAGAFTTPPKAAREDSSSSSSSSSSTGTAAASAYAGTHGLNKNEFEVVTSHFKSITWDKSDSDKFKALYEWSRLYLSVHPLSEGKTEEWNTSQILEQFKRWNENDQLEDMVKTGSIDLVCIPICVSGLGGTSGLWVWDGTAEDKFQLTGDEKNTGWVRQRMHATLHASRAYSGIDDPPLSAHGWRLYWNKLVASTGRPESDDVAAELASDDFRLPAGAGGGGDLTVPNFRNRVRNCGLKYPLPGPTTLGVRPPDEVPHGMPVFLRLDSLVDARLREDMLDYVKKLPMGTWVRVRNVKLTPIAFITPVTQFTPLLPMFREPKILAIGYSRRASEDGISSSSSSSSSSSNSSSSRASRSAPSGTASRDQSFVNKTPPRTPVPRVRRTHASNGMELVPLVTVLSTPAPATFTVAVRITSYTPDNVLGFVRPVSNKPQFAFSVRVEDDTSYADVIVYEKDAVTFFGGLSPKAFQQNAKKRAKVIQALDDCVANNMVIDMTIHSYAPNVPPDEARDNQQVRAQMQYDRERMAKRFRVTKTTLPGLGQ